MSSKVIDVRAGDRFYGGGSCFVWQRREDLYRTVNYREVGNWQELSTLDESRLMHDADVSAYLAGCKLTIDGPTLSPITPPLTESRVIEIVAEMLAEKAKPAPAPSSKPRIDLRDGDTWREYGGTLVQVRGGRCRNCETTEVGEWFDSVNMRNRPEVLPATAICRLAAMGYSFDDMTIGAGSAAKAPPQPDVDAAPEPVRWSDILNMPHSLHVGMDGPVMATSPKWVGKRVVIMDTPANIAPEPDWKGLLAVVMHVVDKAIAEKVRGNPLSAWNILESSPTIAAAQKELSK